MKLLSPIPLKEIIIRKGLNSCRLSNSQTATLQWIVVDKIVTILRYMTGDGCCWRIFQLHAKPITKLTGFPVLVGWCQTRKIELFMPFRGAIILLSKNACKDVPTQIGRHMTTSIMIQPDI
ncbi:hypothetical protein D3C77_671470 [compost metagenome]